MIIVVRPTDTLRPHQSLLGDKLRNGGSVFLRISHRLDKFCFIHIFMYNLSPILILLLPLFHGFLFPLWSLRELDTDSGFWNPLTFIWRQYLNLLPVGVHEVLPSINGALERTDLLGCRPFKFWHNNGIDLLNLGGICDGLPWLRLDNHGQKTLLANVMLFIWLNYVVD